MIRTRPPIARLLPPLYLPNSSRAPYSYLPSLYSALATTLDADELRLGELHILLDLLNKYQLLPNISITISVPRTKGELTWLIWLWLNSPELTSSTKISLTFQLLWNWLLNWLANWKTLNWLRSWMPLKLELPKEFWPSDRMRSWIAFWSRDWPNCELKPLRSKDWRRMVMDCWLKDWVLKDCEPDWRKEEMSLWCVRWGECRR